MVDLFLLPSILEICGNYRLSKAIGGVLIAAGVSMTELTACILSFQRHGVKMTEFGLALVIGGLAYSVSMIPVFAYVLNFGVVNPRPRSSEPSENVSRFQKAFNRDICLSFLSLAFYQVQLKEGSIDLLALCAQLAIFVFYCVAVYV